MLHKEFWGLLFLAFVAWIVLAASPTQRIENACRPVHWVGNVVTSGSALALPKQQVTVQRWFDKIEYGCQYTVWRLFYQEAYNEWVRAEEEARAKAAADAAAASKTGKTHPAEPSEGPQAAPTAPDASKSGATAPPVEK